MKVWRPYRLRSNIIIRLLGLNIFSFLLGFVLIGIIATTVYSTTLNKFSSYLSDEILTYSLSLENRYFGQTLYDKYESPLTLSKGFQVATSIELGDLRTLIGRELPGFAAYNTRIIIAGEGTDFTNIPFESPPPIEVLLQEREASMKELEELDQKYGSDKVSGDAPATMGKHQVFIHHTHSWESFLPHLPGVTDANLATHNEMNITLVGERLGYELEKRGIPTIVDKTNMTEKLHRRNIRPVHSYFVSREIVQAAKAEQEDIGFIFDLHRDSARRDISTVTINNVVYARTLFVIGESHNNSVANERFAKELHESIEKRYPGLSRGIFAKDSTAGNGVYNQDLSKGALLIEIGGVDNDLEEAYRTAEVLAEVFSEYYWNAEKVSN